MFKFKLPGPYAKDFILTLRPKGVYELCKKSKAFKAKFITTIAYVNGKKEIFYFEGRVSGNIVKPKGRHGFGFDFIFSPNGSEKTLAQLKKFGNVKFSARYKAVTKLKTFIDKGTVAK